MDGFFPLKTAADLREKLRRDFAKIEASPLDADAYFNFFVTAECLVDWVLPGKANATVRKNLRTSSIYLQIASHLACGVKHLKLESPQHKSVSSTYQANPEPPGHAPPGFHAPGFLLEFLYVGLEPAAAKEVGSYRMTATLLAQAVLAFWDGYLLDPTV